MSSPSNKAFSFPLSVSTNAAVADSELEALLDTVPYQPYRRHRSVDKRARRRVLLGIIRRDLHKSAAFFAARHEGVLLGLAMVVPLDWDTMFFRQRMMALHVYVGGDYRQAAAKEMFSRILATEFSTCHLMLRLDVGDYDLRVAAEAYGFRIMDTLCNYEHHPDYSSFPDSVEQKYMVRRYTEEDLATILSIAERCFKGYDNRFSRDSSIGPEGARRLYVTWASESCAGRMADHVLVAELRGKVVGFLGWRLLDDINEFAGLQVHGAGIGGCVPIRFDAYEELLWHAINALGGNPADVQTHLQNIATINVYQKLGFKFVGARHTLHYSVRDRC